ncbi:unnamed protein product [Gongylonema pulchrum]|uniref:Uncharacterized protein n=1 Tax=Gongylonema pulchrum TaxID=637853 RepID=A0A183E7Z8_9BILA|nr:unnamed protein product [Gongylonema pulchrum]
MHFGLKEETSTAIRVLCLESQINIDFAFVPVPRCCITRSFNECEGTPFLQALDNYADAPVVQKRSWKGCKKSRKTHAFGDAVPDLLAAAPPKSTISSSCSNGFVGSDLRVLNSAPSTNTSDRSRLTSTTDRSSLAQQNKQSPLQCKNSSNEKLQRARFSMIDASVVGSPTALKQGRPVGKGRAEQALANAGAFVKGIDYDIGWKADGSPDMNYGGKASALAGVPDHPGAATSNEFTHHYRQSSDSIDRSDLFSGDKTNNNDDNYSEHIMPIKITPEAKKILEKNAQLFVRNDELISDDSDKIFSKKETTENSLQQCNVAPGTAAQISTPQQTPLGYLPLKRNTDYGSTISSLTQSSNVKTEISDIDFSWVNDVENRLEREIAFVKEDFRQQQQQQVPVRYFGMDLEHSKNSNGEVSIVPSVETTMKSFEVFGECEARKELSKIHSDVRSKAAMFDMEAFRNERKFDDMQAASRYRSRSTARTNIYIPQPDYQRSDQFSVDTTQNPSPYFSVSTSVRPTVSAYTSERRSHHCAEMSGRDDHHTDKSVYSDAATTRLYSDPRIEVLQRNRAHNDTESYMQNATQCNAEKPWKASIAY